MEKFIKATHHKEILTAEYVSSDEKRFLRSGGTIAWRFNNPGNIRPPSSRKILTRIGIGDTANGLFLIFPDYATGRSELKRTLLEVYGHRNIPVAIGKYAPKNENNTAHYIRTLLEKTGISPEKLIRELSPSELEAVMDSIEKIEGYHHKKETRREQWINSLSVLVSNGHSAVAEQEVVVERNGNKKAYKTDAWGNLPAQLFEKAGETFKFYVPDGGSLKQIGDYVTEGAGKLLHFICDQTKYHAVTRPHSAEDTKQAGAAKPVHTVQPGETLSKIAERYHVSVDTIVTLNHLSDPNKIFPGQRLKLMQGLGETPAKSESKPSTKKVDHSLPSEAATSKKGQPLALIEPDKDRAPWMDTALSEARLWAGKKEREITLARNYHHLTGLSNPSLIGDSNAWCASFVNYCLMRHKKTGTGSPNAQSFSRHPRFVKLAKPVYGAIVVFRSPNGVHGHVAFVYGSGVLIGGNQSDMISFNGFSHNYGDQELVGYFVPIEYKDFAEKEIANGPPLERYDFHKLNDEFGIPNKHTKKTR